MADSNLNFKINKPTMKPPSVMGKKIDSQFKSKMNTAGVNLNMVKESKTMLSEKEESLKKKIFSLPKMETLVMTDEYLSNIFNKMKDGDAKDRWGTHWNETIMNIMFNEYVLKDVGYLQKYKNTKTYNKKRRGEEGVEELERNVQDKVNDKAAENGDELQFDRDKKMSDINKDNLDKFKKELDNEDMKDDSVNEVAERMKKLLAEDEQMNELFGFGKPTAPMTTHKASKNDTYLVRKKDNTAVGVISANLPPQQNQEIATKFADPNLYIRMPWYLATQKGVKGVPAEVQDSTPGEFDALQQKYDGVPAMGVGLSETKGVEMTAGSGFELQFSSTTPAQAEKVAKTDSTYQNDVIYANETTTSASSGAFVGPFPSKRKPVLDKPLWHGGVILKEGADYISKPDTFKNYIMLIESVDKLQDMINESVDEAGISIKQHSQNILAQLDRMKRENPELEQVPEYTEIVKMYSQRAKTGQAEQPQGQANAPTPQATSVGTKSTIPTVTEHHLTSIDAKIDFIINNTDFNQNQLAVMNDNEINMLYAKVEQDMGINESPSFKGAMEKDLHNTGRKAPSTIKGIQNKEGLFKGRWNENLNENVPPAPAVGAPEQAEPETEQGGEDVYSKIGDLVLPDSGKSPQELTKIGQDYIRDFGQYFHNMSPDKIYTLLSDKLKALNLAESMMDDQPDSMARTMDSPELNTAGTGGASATPPVSENMFNDPQDVETPAQGDRQDHQAAADATKFREFLKSKYGVESVADLSPVQKRQIMKDLQVANSASSPAAEPVLDKGMDLKNFAATDAQRAEYQGRDAEQLGFVAAHNAEINSLEDYLALEKKFAAEKGKKMFHPMAILASIESMPAEEKMKYSNVERVLNSRLKGGIEESNKVVAKKVNEERQTPSQLNLQNIKKQTAKLTQQDMANADALKQAKVYPNPDEFYIEQDDAKVQNFQTAEELEAEALKTMEEKKALLNKGDSTNDDNKEISKRNLTKDEMLRLAMNRGDGMHNIVYDLKPADRFEKRLEKDMGADQYKLRQEKMDFREPAPMYNKDTQPNEKGNEAEQDNKFKAGFNEAFTGKYTDDFGKSRLVEFMMTSVKEVADVKEGFKLSLEGLGNKYTVKINENQVFSDVALKFDFYYLMEGNIVCVKKSDTTPEVIVESEMEKKMKHLMNYNQRDFVNTKKSIKF